MGRFFPVPLVGLLILAGPALEVRASIAGDLPVAVSVDAAYLPGIYDDNDTVEIVVEGTLPFACYALSKADATVDSERHKIELNLTAESAPGDCPSSSGPDHFVRVLKIGVLAEGAYLVSQGGRALGSISISHTDLPQQDSSSLAPVTRLSLFKAQSGDWTARLEGEFDHSCYEYKRSNYMIESNVIVLFPIVRLGEFGCRDETVPFDVQTELPSGIPAGRYLLHVRSSGGRSLNHVLTIEP